MKKSFILTILISFAPLWAQTSYPTKDFSSPRKTMNYFLKTMKAYKLGDKEAIDLAIETFDTSQLPADVKTQSAKLAAVKLINTLDRIEYINVQTIPETVEGKIWYYRKQTVPVEQENKTVEIALALSEKEKNWLFTPNTLATIADFEHALVNKKTVKGVVEYSDVSSKIKKMMPAWTGHRTFILLNGQWLGIFFLILLSFIVERILHLYLARVMRRFYKSEHVRAPEQMLQSFGRPLSLLTFSSLWFVGINLLEFEAVILSYLSKFGRLLFLFGLIAFVYRLVDLVANYLEEKAQLTENRFDDILVPLLRKAAKTFTIAVGVIAIGDSLSLDMKGLLAGMGIVGLGVSLAAKDTISNLFGSLTVLLDRPFHIGDWVVIDGKIEGIVEEVGLRSCRIRTFYNSLITIPNGMLTNAHIDNYGMRSIRRYSTTLALEYDTPSEKVELFCQKVRQLIMEHPHTYKDNFHVYFNNMGAHSLEIMLYVFFSAPTWGEELQHRHDLLKQILNLGQELDVSFAFPTQTIHFKPDEQEGPQLPSS